MGLSGLSASLQIFQEIRREHGESAIERRVLHLADVLISKLSKLGVTTRSDDERCFRSGIVTIDLPSALSPASIRKQALSKQIVTSVRDGGLRASIHAYNTEEEIGRLVSVIANNI